MCAAGAETTPWKNPSSSGQLPVPVALNAPSPTLFRSYYTPTVKKSKGVLEENGKELIHCVSIPAKRPEAIRAYSPGNHR